MSIVLNPVRANIGSGLDLEVRLCAWLACQEMLGHAQSQATQAEPCVQGQDMHACFAQAILLLASLPRWHVLLAAMVTLLKCLVGYGSWQVAHWRSRG